MTNRILRFPCHPAILLTNFAIFFLMIDQQINFFFCNRWKNFSIICWCSTGKYFLGNFVFCNWLMNFTIFYFISTDWQNLVFSFLVTEWTISRFFFNRLVNSSLTDCTGEFFLDNKFRNFFRDQKTKFKIFSYFQSIYFISYFSCKQKN